MSSKARNQNGIWEQYCHFSLVFERPIYIAVRIEHIAAVNDNYIRNNNIPAKMFQFGRGEQFPV